MDFIVYGRSHTGRIARPAPVAAVGNEKEVALPQFAVARSFVEGTRAIASLAELQVLLDHVTRELNFDYFALVQHVDLINRENGRTIALSTYPAAWIERYVSRNLVTDDPVHLASHRTNIGFSWDQIGSLIPVSVAHRKIRDDTLRAGIGEGYTVPANIPGEINASCSFANRVGRALPRDSLHAAHLIGAFAFEAARRIVRQSLILPPPPQLSRRQLECLIWWGRGKGDWEIGQILSLSPATVAEYLEAARRRHDAVKRGQLLARAAHAGQVAIADMAR